MFFLFSFSREDYQKSQLEEDLEGRDHLKKNQQVQMYTDFHKRIQNRTKYCYALPVSQMSCSIASICIDDPRTLTFVCDCGSRGHTVS